jgi:hypothetical protein
MMKDERIRAIAAQDVLWTSVSRLKTREEIVAGIVSIINQVLDDASLGGSITRLGRAVLRHHQIMLHEEGVILIDAVNKSNGSSKKYTLGT